MENENTPVDLAKWTVKDFVRKILADQDQINARLKSLESLASKRETRISEIEKRIAIMDDRQNTRHKTLATIIAVLGIAAPLLTGLIMWLIDMARYAKMGL